MDVKEQIADAVLQGIKNTWEKGDQALASEINRAILAIDINGIPLGKVIEKYRFKTHIVTHVICSRCGIATRHIVAYGDKSLHCEVCEPLFRDW